MWVQPNAVGKECLYSNSKLEFEVGCNAMEYYFNNLDATAFQRLVNTILVARLGEDARLTPLRGADGGRDAETAPGNPYFEYQVIPTSPPSGLFAPLRKGRYLFQVKHHRTVDTRISDARKLVVSDFQNELKANVLSRSGTEGVNYFFLITNVPSSKDALESLDRVRGKLLKGQNIHADIWWQEQITAYLDLMPSVWRSFPNLFPGNVVPLLARVAEDSPTELPRAVRMMLDHQYARDSKVKFRQINLEQSLSKLFVDLEVGVHHLSYDDKQCLLNPSSTEETLPHEDVADAASSLVEQFQVRHFSETASAVGLMLDESVSAARKILLEGGPGQGKSTITQMAAQIYRQHVLGKHDLDPEGRWSPPQKLRLPFRIELKDFAEWLNEHADASVEEYLAFRIKKYSGGSPVTTDSIHNIVEGSPVMLIFDGLDEIGSDELRDKAIEKIIECVDRFERVLHSDLRVVITTRPPAIVGRRESLIDFVRFPVVPMGDGTIQNYVSRWLSVQPQDDEDELNDIRESFEIRKNEPHVEALITNPMQLSVLLHFIKLKGPAFPDRRAELYRDYFKVLIDRDIDKSPGLRKNREIIEALHQVLGYKIHALTEVEQSDGTLSRNQLLEVVSSWLKTQGAGNISPRDLFKLGEERLGLIVSPKGEGEETRYGYEIQPIREYFAAAFINDQIKGNAHEVFQELVRRAFWREVALFLAGLRRPNEKADLLSRAKALDLDNALGWRQDGRVLTLQLLIEGVFSQPPHVFADAVDFIIDLLDPEIVKVQGEIRELNEQLLPLIKQSETQRHINRLLGILQRNNTSEDIRFIHRLFKLLSSLLKPEELRGKLMLYGGSNSHIRALTRLMWPYFWGVDMSKAARTSSYWEGVPESTWIGIWWLTAKRNNAATKLPAPTKFHQSLVETYALDTSALITPLQWRKVDKPFSNWAVWHLAFYQKMLTSVFRIRNKEELHSLLKVFNSVRKNNIEFDGLNKPTQVLLMKLIDAHRGILSTLLSPSEKWEEALSTYISTLNKYMNGYGLSSWLACKCAIDFIKSIAGPTHTQLELPAGKRGVIQGFIRRTAEGEQFVAALHSLYTGEITNRNKLRGDFRKDLYPLFTSSPRAIAILPPKYIRVKQKEGLVAVTELLANYICNKKKFPFAWMKYMRVDSASIPTLLKTCRGKIEDLLIGLREFSFVQRDAEKLLSARDTLRVVNIVRVKNDPKILQGAQIALLSATSVKRIPSEILLKLLRADNRGTLYSTRLFSYMRLTSVYNQEKKKDPAEIAIRIEVAKQILVAPDDYASNMVSAAATFVIENSPLSLSPLKNEEERLRIHS
jgi:hypothetical protein